MQLDFHVAICSCVCIGSTGRC